ncbi:MAG TPA: aromatic ring-hydroxylating dioxygenase subunit alpha [Solirubrobacterales bacterium]|nr:aromatic ring-hydroxylating dioxygenase subunit alpha [Solirubrobacterales bacterium]
MTLNLDAAQVRATLEPLERASMLPPAAFTDPAVFDWELDNVFSGWVCVGHASAVAETGRFMMREIGPSSVVVIGGEDGRPRAFLNVCRHRGARIVTETEGSVRRRLQCSYHAWSYALDGELRAAPHMDGVEDFEPSCYGLVPVRLAVAGGLAFVDLGGEAPEVADHVGELAAHLDRYRLGSLARAGERRYAVDANWKAIAENYNECLHCPGVHPELNELSHYMSGEEVVGAGAWCGGSMTLREDAKTMGTGDGHASSRPPISGLEAADLDSVLYFALFPNALVSLHPDYVMLHTLWPRAAERTEVVCEWYFEPETIAADGFDPSDAIEFWDQVNREDWHVCELTQKGVRTRGYTPGRYSAEEVDVHAFDVMVAERYIEALREPAGVGL